MLVRFWPVPGLASLMAALFIGCAGATVATTTATPPATAVPSPAATPETGASHLPGLTDAQDLTSTAMTYLTDLAVELGSRESATGEEQEAAEYLESQFSDFGYSAELQPFQVERLSQEESGLVLDMGQGVEKVEVLPLSGSSNGEVSGVLEPVGLGRTEDLPEGGLEGKIALAERGLITFGRKARNAREAGAVGVVIYNNLPGNFRGNLGYSADIPVVAISRSDGQRLADRASTGKLEATVSLKTEEVPSRNVIAEKPGTGDGIIIVGAHYDTVGDVPGASDNASGTAVVLTIAQALSGASLPFSVRLIAFGSEELGLLGSRAYVDSLSGPERDRIIAMLNFDALGSGDSLRVLGDQQLTDLVLEQGRLQGIDVEVAPGLQGGSSDHAVFARAGVPVVMVFSDDASRIHTPEDTLQYINPDLLGGAARLGLGLLDALTESC